jgi:hypothetical protein
MCTKNNILNNICRRDNLDTKSEHQTGSYKEKEIKERRGKDQKVGTYISQDIAQVTKM